MKTIKEIAGELGVSKQAIRRYLDKLPPTSVVTGANRVIMIDPSGEAVLRSLMQTKSVTEPQTLPQTEKDKLLLELQHKIELLELEKELNSKSHAEQLEILNRELDRKNDIIKEQLQQLKELNSGILQAQALHAGTMQKQLMEPEHSAGFFTRLFSSKR
jgi:predicted ArsR family transcriptional regulator